MSADIHSAAPERALTAFLGLLGGPDDDAVTTLAHDFRALLLNADPANLSLRANLAEAAMMGLVAADSRFSGTAFSTEDVTAVARLSGCSPDAVRAAWEQYESASGAECPAELADLENSRCAAARLIRSAAEKVHLPEAALPSAVTDPVGLASGTDIATAAEAFADLPVSEDWIPEFTQRLPAKSSRMVPPRAANTAPRHAREAVAVAMRWNGATLEEVGERFGVTRERARQIVQRAGGPTRTQVEEAREEIRNLERNSRTQEYRTFLDSHPPMTVSELAERLGVERDRLLEDLSPELRDRLLPEDRVAPTVTWTREAAIRALQEAATYEFPLTVNAYNELILTGAVHGPSVPRVGQIFGLWTVACEAAGVEPGAAARTNYSSKWTDDDLVAAVQEFLASATRKSFAAYEQWARQADDRPSGQTVRNRLGAWNAVRRLAMTTSSQGGLDQ